MGIELIKIKTPREISHPPARKNIQRVLNPNTGSIEFKTATDFVALINLTAPVIRKIIADICKYLLDHDFIMF
jgi:hypothetical protein